MKNMDEKERRKALANFLQTRRARLSPTQQGFPEGRRRTPGLRREEVAELVGISSTWYTWLEQARAIQVSVQVLESLARVFHLNPDEKEHLFQLSGHTLRVSWHDEQEEVLPKYQQILLLLEPSPAYLTGFHCDLLAWNQAAVATFGDFSLMPHRERNIVRYTFTNQVLRQRLRNWDAFAQGTLALFRATCGRSIGDPWLTRLITELSEQSVEFRQWWSHHEVQGQPETCLLFTLPDQEPFLLEPTMFQVGGHQEMKLFVYTLVSDIERIKKILSLPY